MKEWLNSLEQMDKIAFGIAIVILMVSCSKDPDCQTTQIGSIEKIIIKNGVNEISYSPIYETICL